MNEFEDRLRRAVDRGDQRNAARVTQSRQAAMDESELRNLHNTYRLSLTEQIERCLRSVVDHFPGFRAEMVFGERGWGTAISRDDIEFSRDKKRSSGYSRLELTIRPFSNAHVLELLAKGTVHNREVFHRSHFVALQDVDPRDFAQRIDAWVVEYAEYYAANRA